MALQFATTKQIRYVLSLCSEIQNESVTSLTEVRCIPLHPEDLPGAMTQKDAAKCINELENLRKNLNKIPMYQDPDQPFTNDFLAELYKTVMRKPRK